MKNSLRFLALAALAAIPFVGRAQVTYATYTNSDSSGSPVGLNSGFATAVQTFTGFSNLSSMSWSLTNSGGDPAAATFNAYVAEWNTGTLTAQVGTLTPFQVGGVSTGSIGAGLSTNLTFTDSLPALNPSLTYALVLSYAGGDQTFFANTGTNPGGAFFGSGGAGYAFTSSDLGSFQNDLETAGTPFGIDSGSAYTMSVTAGLAGTPVPEPKTAGAGIAAMFVAALVGRRVWQRNKLTPVPLAA